MKFDIDEILIRVLQGKATAEDRQFLNIWLQESKINRRVFQSLQQYWQQEVSTEKSSTLSKESIWASRIRPAKQRFDWKPFQAVAAIIIIMLTLAYFLKDQILIKNPEPVQVQPITMITKSAAAGAKLETILPDGSLVKLNSESKLQYPSNFNDSLREVNLIGEAYFEVKHDPEKPFVVKSNGVKTMVLGTKFVVSAYAEEEIVKVALASGKVQTENLNIDNQSLNILKPGEYIDYKQNEIRKGLFDHKEVFGWKDGLLFFKNSNYSEAIAKLERWFGVEIILEGEKPNWKLNGEYQNANLESILSAVSYSQGFEYEFLSDKLVKIKSK